MVGCGGSDNKGTEEILPPPVEKDASGWHMTKWEIGSEDANFPKEVYLVFAEDGTFSMYQDVASNGFEKLTGTYAFDEASKKLSGVYSDGEAWAYDYTVGGVDSVIGKEGQKMTLTATSDADYKLTFVYGEIPETVTGSVLGVRSGVSGMRIL